VQAEFKNILLYHNGKALRRFGGSVTAITIVFALIMKSAVIIIVFIISTTALGEFDFLNAGSMSSEVSVH
jgi:hypothetical protein